MKNNRELKIYYKNNINIPIFRVVAGEDYRNIIKNGINIKNNPYTQIKKEILILNKIIKKIDKKNIKIYIKWGKREVSALYVLNIIKTDLNKKFIDFAPDKKSVTYYLTLTGGALTTDLKSIIKEIKNKKIKLSKIENESINKIEKFIKIRDKKNKIIYIKGSESIFEKALFQPKRRTKKRKKQQIKENKEYWESPFGSFNHFRRVVGKHGLRKYSYFLRNKKYYLRINKNIPKEIIKKQKQD